MSTRSSRRSSPRILAALVALILAVVAGCSGGGGGAGLTVTDAWVRVPAGGETTTAAYFVVRNAGTVDDTLTGVSSAAAGSASLHESAMDSSGMMGMSPVGSVAVAAGATVTFEPGGYHVMLEGLTRALAAGDRIALTLTFAKAGNVTVSAEVRGG